MSTLKDVLPREFMNGEYADTSAMRYRDIEVVAVRHDPWPGREKYVSVWFVLVNGRAVGWNENPHVGWSFPCRTVFPAS